MKRSFGILLAGLAVTLAACGAAKPVSLDSRVRTALESSPGGMAGVRSIVATGGVVDIYLDKTDAELADGEEADAVTTRIGNLYLEPVLLHVSGLKTIAVFDSAQTTLACTFPSTASNGE
jgi:hypothetical protein